MFTRPGMGKSDDIALRSIEQTSAPRLNIFTHSTWEMYGDVWDYIVKMEFLPTVIGMEYSGI